MITQNAVREEKRQSREAEIQRSDIEDRGKVTINTEEELGGGCFLRDGKILHVRTAGNHTGCIYMPNSQTRRHGESQAEFNGIHTPSVCIETKEHEKLKDHRG